MAPEPLEYRPSRWRMGVFSAVLLLFVVGYVWGLTGPKLKPGDREILTLGLIGFGVAFVATLFPLFRPKARLRFDAEGISERGHFGGENMRLPWSNLLRVETFTWRFLPIIALVPFDLDRALADASPSMRKAAKRNASLYGHPFVIDARMYAKKTADLVAEIERRLATAPSSVGAYPRSASPRRGEVPFNR